MKVEVTFYVGGKNWKKTYVVSNPQDQKMEAVSRNPVAKVVVLNPVY